FVVTDAATGTSVSDTVNDTDANSLFLDAVSVNNTLDTQLSAGGSQMKDVANNANSGGVVAGMSHATGAASLAMSWSWSSGSLENSHIGFVVNPSTGAAPTRLLLSVGP